MLCEMQCEWMIKKSRLNANNCSFNKQQHYVDSQSAAEPVERDRERNSMYNILQVGQPAEEKRKSFCITFVLLLVLISFMLELFRFQWYVLMISAAKIRIEKKWSAWKKKNWREVFTQCICDASPLSIKWSAMFDYKSVQCITLFKQHHQKWHSKWVFWNSKRIKSLNYF